MCCARLLGGWCNQNKATPASMEQNLSYILENNTEQGVGPIGSASSISFFFFLVVMLGSEAPWSLLVNGDNSWKGTWILCNSKNRNRHGQASQDL